MKKTMICLAATILLTTAGSPAFTWETYDSVIAIVNDISIIESEIDNKLNQVIKFQNIPRTRYASEKSRILDKFIEDALVMQAATEEAIVVGDRRVLNHIEEMMKQYLSTKIQDPKEVEKLASKMLNRLEKRLNDEPIMADKELDAQIDTFIGFLEGRVHLGFREYFEEVRSQIMREQVMSIAIGVSPPSKEEAMDWYRKNRNKLGDEVWVKHILIRPAGSSFTAERETNEKLNSLREKIMAGESFEKLARMYSQDPESAARGGDLGWKMLAEMDPYFAGYVSNIHAAGQVSQVFKSSQGYHIVKLMARRPITYEKVERLIMYKLYNESMFQQFKKWVLKRKKESDIQIFMKNYVET
ncbi:MAG TPA: peptidylprolyl isomerase [Spirochaetota bacterium]|nr:peptidylprolyl isomerase [Spirochaetota bacterium]HPC39408.1 peptidylprolyl isomerase [Spirochaetota bacterium]HPL16895.1 peptidylprolyl isomerase [Spirochaetota bacterium]HQF06745.1 peptidylprolyl isomerase [Spirochaetota bacterium]HQH95636.1 peptidylprolyl isomerase [Spirochaetota bacterium]